MKTLLAALAAVPIAFPLAVLLGATPVLADESYDAPASGSFSLLGHGWGHGRGLSQWGAEGGAQAGKGVQDILDAYYPGTTRSTVPDAPVRVWITGGDGADTTVAAQDGLQLVKGGTATTLPGGASAWRVVASGTGEQVQSLTAGTWTAYGPVDPGPVGFTGASTTAPSGGTPSTVTLQLPGGVARDYRGTVTALRTGGGITTIVVLGMEDYLLGVVPREAVTSWHPAALQAQAVAARTYADARRAAAGSAPYDLCDSTSCQVFGGTALHPSGGGTISLEVPSTSDAVHATAGEVRTYGGRPIDAQFSSSNGGWEVDGGRPYLPARADPWDAAGASVHSWTAQLPVRTLEAAFPSLGDLVRLRVVSRDGHGDLGGRVQGVVLEGVRNGRATSLRTTGAAIYAARSWPATSDGLRSDWWGVRAAAQSAPADALVGQDPDPVAGPTATVTASLRNTGGAPWDGPSLHLVTSSPPGALDSLVGGSTTPGTFTGNLSRPGAPDVQPGEVAQLTVTIDAREAAPGTYPRSYRLAGADGAPYGAVVSWHVTVPDPRAAAVVTAPPEALTVPPGQRAVVLVRLRNTGGPAWPVGGEPLHATGGPVPDAVLAGNATHPGASAVPAGDTGLWRVALPGTSPGHFRLRLRLQGPAGPYGPTLSTVLAVAAPDLSGRTSSPRVTVARAGRTVTFVDVRNLGDAAWPVRGALRLTANHSPSRDRSWTGAGTVGPVTVDATDPGSAYVLPGQVARITLVLAGNGRAPGMRTERFGLTWDGVANSPVRATVAYAVR